MTEAAYTYDINRRVKAAGCHAQKFSDRFNAGVPDCWYSGPKADLWAEFKWVKAFPKKTPIKPRLSKLQEIWLDRRHKEGRLTAVIVACPEGAIVYHGASWQEPASRTKTKIHSRKELVQRILEIIS